MHFVIFLFNGRKKGALSVHGGPGMKLRPKELPRWAASYMLDTYKSVGNSPDNYPLCSGASISMAF